MKNVYILTDPIISRTLINYTYTRKYACIHAYSYAFMHSHMHACIMSKATLTGS